MKKQLITGLLLSWAMLTGWAPQTLAQTTFPRNGVYDERPNLYAFTNATIVVDPRTTLQNATLLIRNGRIEAVGNAVSVPAGAVVINLQGKRIYPGLIDLDSDYGMPDLPKRAPGGFNAPPQLESNKKGPYYWNQAIQPETDAGQLFKVVNAKAEELRKLGFGAVLTHAHDGIARGNGTLVTLADDRENTVVLRNGLSQHFSFSKGSSTQNNPNSIMGVVAVLRQAFYDADWYKKTGPGEQANLSLDALSRAAGLPAFFEAGDKFGVLRADRIGDEFGRQFIIRGGGDEYQRIDEIKATGATLILPVSYPQAYDVEDAWDADNVSLAEMKHWEMAPANPAMLAQAGIPFALTSAGLKTRADFMANVRKAIENGLTEAQALEALTTRPAQLIRADDLLGSLAVGKLANFIVTSGNLFAADNVIYENWIRGKQYILANRGIADLRGTYDLNITPQAGAAALKLLITGTNPDKPDYQIMANDTTKLTPKVAIDNNLVSMQVALDKKQPNALTRLTGYRNGSTLQGDGQLASGQVVAWSATLSKPFVSTAATAKTDTAKKTPMGGLLYPFVGMGNAKKPQPQAMLIRNATVWTNEKDGILTTSDVLVTNGKIAQVGKNLTAPTGASVIDGTGKHLTNGIIDEHSHIALFSINEGSQSSTAEVRMADAINPDDVNIYRQLAGGVTSSQLLHGSANAIGGQSALVKLKWGEPADGLLIKGADGFIKFALGENVKQANWGEANRVRFPQTRMGVEQVYMDHFIRAKEYAKAWAEYTAKSEEQRGKSKGKSTTAGTLVAPRRDLELDALAEILNKKRFITCHSYVQSEINMLMHVADSLGFKVNTFTHILEGYKVADKMAKHGVGGSTFSDWWAYKMEVKDAIPYNAALMAREGVTVSINSDDAEMARRLNQEAAKTVEYGGISEEDAWKMVTLNPAKLLHLDSHMGSIRPGKDADLVLWNNHPLSIYARPDYTIIDGAIYYSQTSDEQNRTAMQAERARLIQKMIQAKAGGQTTTRPTARRQRMWHCEDIEGVMAEGENK
ncbi:amidohydrolase family protein [Fibrella aquatilis]|uniref:Amidohydrolase family protein n=1 Tax=Fibrella aquatilis TaxID=2817059 RepID=A0A939G5T0_9BACT|nr:amidohydrolase family protein [Fibrella aquatilis]MBO0931738.1 amidohydrolase family protein [Fibrella aquatilis]